MTSFHTSVEQRELAELGDGWRIAVEQAPQLVAQIGEYLRMLIEQQQRPGQRVGRCLVTGSEDDAGIARQLFFAHCFAILVAGLVEQAYR